MIKIHDRSKVQHITARMQGIVRWNDVWIDYQYALDNDKFGQEMPHGFITFSGHLSLPRVRKYCEAVGGIDAHMYVAFSKEYPSLGLHKDPMDVLYTQSIGETTWEIQGTNYYLGAGDAIYVPKGVEHRVTSHGARVGVSVGL